MRQIQEDLAGKLGVLALLDLLRGMVADIAIHAAHRKGDHRNGHAHVMLTMRERTAKGFGAKVRDRNSPELLEHWREQWAHHQNRALERAGRPERADHRSLDRRRQKGFFASPEVMIDFARQIGNIVARLWSHRSMSI